MKDRTKSARSKGAIGKNAIVPRVILKLLEDSKHKAEHRILDFGCGKDMIHVLELIKHGYNVVGYDINLPETESFLQKIDSYGWDIIYLSNVINVQPSKEALDFIFDRIFYILHPFGFAVANYPNKPRYMEWSVDEMYEYLKTRFPTVIRVNKKLAGNNVVWILRKQ